MTGALWRSAFVAAVFAIHPLRVESVAWVAERKDVLSGVFFLLTLGAYLRYVRAPSIGRYLAVALMFLLGLMSKPMLVTLPVILLLLDYWPLNRWRHLSPTPSKATPDWPLRTSIPYNLVIEKIPLLALSIVSSVVTVLAQKQAIGWIEQLPLGWRLTNAAVSYVAYVWQMIWPVNLAAFYPHPENRLPVWEIILAVVALVAVTVAALARRKSHPYLITGWLWYIIMLVPVIGLMQVGWQGRADRYTYLPQIGLIVLVTWAIADLSAGWRRQRELLAMAAALVIVVLSCIARKQTFYWHDSERLWTHTLAVTSNNDVAQTNLGIVLLERGKTDAAIARFEQAVELRPQNGPAHENLAKTFLQQGRLEEAMTHYRTVLEIQPENSEARNILGMLLFQRGRIKDAVGQWEQTLRMDPENGNAKNNLAWVFATCPNRSIRDGVKAVQLGEQAAQLSSGRNPMVLRTLAAAYAESGRFPEAIATAQRGAEVAIKQGNSALAGELQSNIALYQTNSPLRDTRAVDATE
jgi:Flp pilus assembly protein TadD